MSQAENRLADYEIQQTINEHQGIVLQKVLDKTEGLDCAIHSIQKTEDKQTYTFENLMYVYSMLKSPFLLNVVDAFEDSKTYYIVREWSDKPNLREYVAGIVKDKDQIKENTLWDIIVAVSQSLYFLHMSGIVHRHLTLNNIFMQNQSHARISDFNIYRFYEDTTELGTDFIDVAAPEVLQECPVFTPKSDIWAFGCILYEIIMKERPFKGETVSELEKAIKDEDPKPLPRYLSPEVTSMIYSMLNKDPLERPSIETMMKLTKAKQRLNTVVPNLFPGMPELLKEQKQLLVRYEFERREQERLEKQLAALKKDPTLVFPVPPYPPPHLRGMFDKKPAQKKEEPKPEPNEKQEGTDQSVLKNEDGEAPSEQTEDGEAKNSEEQKEEKEEDPIKEDPDRPATEKELHDAIRYLMRTQYFLRVKLPRLTPSQSCALTLWRGQNILLARMDMMPKLGYGDNALPIVPPGHKIRIEGNRICLKSEKRAVIQFEPAMRGDMFRIDFGFVASAKDRWVGVCDKDFQFDEDYDPGEDGHTATYTGATGAVWHCGGYYNSNRIYHDTDHVAMEVNYTVNPPTLHFLCFDQYQPVYFSGIPEDLRFWIMLGERGCTVEILNYSQPCYQRITDVDNMVALKWGEKPPKRPAKKVFVPPMGDDVKKPKKTTSPLSKSSK
ncbi:putative protein kinase [Blattamonas nauphoetae]|uniref:Protein kinase domain-containing protein n=1 Tax=Blattamonas nauphoetae TaxID=2049346 RepID=A0ABQ9YHU1_9EUKA|nr:putative protein kinase [Blattamonas nauphoetae]